MAVISGTTVAGFKVNIYSNIQYRELTIVSNETRFNNLTICSSFWIPSGKWNEPTIKIQNHDKNLSEILEFVDIMTCAATMMNQFDFYFR